jgi:hypothetical protein
LAVKVLVTEPETASVRVGDGENDRVGVGVNEAEIVDFIDGLVVIVNMNDIL